MHFSSGYFNKFYCDIYGFKTPDLKVLYVIDNLSSLVTDQ